MNWKNLAGGFFLVLLIASPARADNCISGSASVDGGYITAIGTISLDPCNTIACGTKVKVSVFLQGCEVSYFDADFTPSKPLTFSAKSTSTYCSATYNVVFEVDIKAPDGTVNTFAFNTTVTVP